MIEYLGIAGGGIDQTEDHADGGGLAGAVRSEKAEDVAAAHAEVKVVDRPQAAEVLGELVGGEDDGTVGARLVRRPSRLRAT